MLRFQFNRKHHQPVVVEGKRVELSDGLITVVDAQGLPRMTFDEAELSSWWKVSERVPSCPRKGISSRCRRPDERTRP